MVYHRMRTSQHSLGRPLLTGCRLFLVGGLAACVLAGCQEDQITRYRAPRPEHVQVDAPPEAQPTVRLLAAILPREDRTWFFKLVGPIPVIAEQEEAFDRFIASVRFTDQPKQPITWKVPEGWQEEPGKGMRYATIKLGPKDALVYLTVSVFPGEGGSVLDNVNRWRKLDLGLKPVVADHLDIVTREIRVGDVKGTRIDMKGPGVVKP